MKIKIAVIADTHFSSTPGIAIPSRKKEFGDIFLNRAVHRINRFIEPDITLLLGDLIDDAQKQDLEIIKNITDGLKGPKLVVPGNHDGNHTQFFEVFPELPDYLDVTGYRFVPFCDAEAPGYNATRSKQDLARMKRVRQGYNGPVIAIQHVPLFPPGEHECPYNLTNAEIALQIMREADIRWVIAGHYHPGFQLECGNSIFAESEGRVNMPTSSPAKTKFSHSNRPLFSVATPALCEKPFRFLEINIDGQKTQTVEHQLSMPAELQLSDFHIHSHFAYCNENMDFEKVLELIDLFNLANMLFTEHSAHLYFTKENCAGAYLHKGLKKTKNLISSRISAYYDEVKNFIAENVLLGLEVDSDFSGRSVLFDEDRDKFNIFLGGMHHLPPETRKDVNLAAKAFLTILEKFLVYGGIDILAHPFRVFRRSGLPTPEYLFPKVVRLLKEHNIAAELNFHTNEPPLEFVRMCLEENVKFAFGSDAHNLYEVGEFYPNLQLLQEAGYTGSLEDILYPFPCPA